MKKWVYKDLMKKKMMMMITMELMMMMMMMTMKWHRPTGVENVESDAKHLNNNLLQLKLLSSASWSWIIILIKKIVLSSSLSWIIIIIEIKVKPLVACKLIFPPEEMSLMSLLSWELEIYYHLWNEPRVIDETQNNSFKVKMHWRRWMLAELAVENFSKEYLRWLLQSVSNL